MREVRTEIEIGAPAAKVWQTLTDFDHWSEWNPIVNQASGTASAGAKLCITMTGNDGKDGPKYNPDITSISEPKYFRWRAKMMAGFLFTNDKVFELEETSAGTRLIHTELYSGMLVLIFWSKLNEHVPTMLNNMNIALKEVVETE